MSLQAVALSAYYTRHTKPVSLSLLPSLPLAAPLCFLLLLPLPRLRPTPSLPPQPRAAASQCTKKTNMDREKKNKVLKGPLSLASRRRRCRWKCVCVCVMPKFLPIWASTAPCCHDFPRLYDRGSTPSGCPPGPISGPKRHRMARHPISPALSRRLSRRMARQPGCWSLQGLG